MKKILSVNQTSNAVDIGLLIARVAIAALMLTHGIPKLLMLFSGEPVQFPSVMGMSASFSLALAVFAEVFCSLFLLFGFGTRLAAIPLAVTMLVAVFLIHAADPLSVKEPALQYLLVYSTLLFAGSGKYSIDYLLQPKLTPVTPANKAEDAARLLAR
ncbi:MAG: DoxX family protein [Sphingobacteriaceae bacterium]|jgi:putative oxidoreductase|nr:DoxX family protein [Sphingobacteriaceae bacterium]